VALRSGSPRTRPSGLGSSRGYACGGCDPANDLPVVAVEREGDPHHLAAPAGELQAVRAPADIGSQRDDTTVVGARSAATGVPSQQQAMLLHEAVDALCIDRLAT